MHFRMQKFEFPVDYQPGSRIREFLSPISRKISIDNVKELYFLLPCCDWSVFLSLMQRAPPAVLLSRAITQRPEEFSRLIAIDAEMAETRALIGWPVSDISETTNVPKYVSKYLFFEFEKKFLWQEVPDESLRIFAYAYFDTLHFDSEAEFKNLPTPIFETTVNGFLTLTLGAGRLGARATSSSFSESF